MVSSSPKFNDEILKINNFSDIDYLFINKTIGVNKYTLIKDDETYFVSDFRKILLRDKKINNLLDE